MKVDKIQFDTLLGKLLKAPPLPKASIPPKRVRLRSDRPTQEAEPKSPKP
jgi:hypothetical protein